MSKKTALPFIRTEPLTSFVTVISLIVSGLILVFAINYEDLLLSLAALGQIAFTLVGTAIAQTSGVDFKDKRESKKEASRDLTFGLFAVVMFIMIDILVPLTLKVPITSDRLPASLIPTVTFIFLTNQAIPEEKFFRGGVCNFLLKLSRGLPFPAFWAALGSAATWAIYHWPAEQGNWINIIAILFAGIVIAIVDMTTTHEITSIIAHTLNNALASTYAIIAGINLTTIAIIPHLIGVLHP